MGTGKSVTVSGYTISGTDAGNYNLLNTTATALDQARVTARRAERRLVALAPVGRQLRPLVLQFVNRLSDLLWLMAREAERGS